MHLRIFSSDFLIEMFDLPAGPN